MLRQSSGAALSKPEASFNKSKDGSGFGRLRVALALLCYAAYRVLAACICPVINRTQPLGTGATTQYSHLYTDPDGQEAFSRRSECVLLSYEVAGTNGKGSPPLPETNEDVRRVTDSRPVVKSFGKLSGKKIHCAVMGCVLDSGALVRLELLFQSSISYRLPSSIRRTFVW